MLCVVGVLRARRVVRRLACGIARDGVWGAETSGTVDKGQFLTRVTFSIKPYTTCRSASSTIVVI
jgi:hypothetical protein